MTMRPELNENDATREVGDAVQRIAIAALIAAGITYFVLARYVEHLRAAAVTHAIESGEPLGSLALPWFANPGPMAVLVGALVVAGGVLWRVTSPRITGVVLAALAAAVISYAVMRPITERGNADATEEERLLKALSAPWYMDPVNIAVLVGLATLVIGLVFIIVERDRP